MNPLGHATLSHPFAGSADGAGDMEQVLSLQTMGAAPAMDGYTDACYGTGICASDTCRDTGTCDSGTCNGTGTCGTSTCGNTGSCGYAT